MSSFMAVGARFGKTNTAHKPVSFVSIYANATGEKFAKQLKPEFGDKYSEEGES